MSCGSFLQTVPMKLSPSQAQVKPLLLVGRAPNARHELLPKAEARNERTLEAVSSMPLLGWAFRAMARGNPI